MFSTLLYVIHANLGIPHIRTSWVSYIPFFYLKFSFPSFKINHIWGIWGIIFVIIGFLSHTTPKEAVSSKISVFLWKCLFWFPHVHIFHELLNIKLSWTSFIGINMSTAAFLEHNLFLLFIRNRLTSAISLCEKEISPLQNRTHDGSLTWSWIPFTTLP